MAQNWELTRTTPVLSATTTAPTYVANTGLEVLVGAAESTLPASFCWYYTDGPRVHIGWRLKLTSVANVGVGQYLMSLPVPPAVHPQQIGVAWYIDQSIDARCWPGAAVIDPYFSATQAMVFLDADPAAANPGDLGAGEVIMAASFPNAVEADDIIFFTGSYIRA